MLALVRIGGRVDMKLKLDRDGDADVMQAVFAAKTPAELRMSLAIDIDDPDLPNGSVP
jgi:hypothetical protein